MRYEMTAIRAGDGIQALSLEAADETEAMRQAKSQGYAILAIRRKHSWHGWMENRRAHFPLTLFSQELLALLDAGLTLVEAIEALAEKSTVPRRRRSCVR